MKWVLLLAAILFSISVAAFQESTAGNSSLAVISFGVEEMGSRSGLAGFGDDTSAIQGPAIPQHRVTGGINPTLQRDEDLGRRSDDLRRTEDDARRAPGNARGDYQYKLKAKNMDQRVVERVIWQFETADPADARNPTVRQFLCGNRIKPNQTKEFRIVTPFAPSNVVSAVSAGKSSDKSSNQKAVINKIEYADGTVWQRLDWDPARAEGRLTDETYKSANGRCVVL